MSWMTRQLILDLLAIAIDGLNRAFKRISAEGGQGAVSPWDEQPEPTPTPQEAPPAPTTPSPEPAPLAADSSFLPQAQNILRIIAQQPEGTAWITGTLFPQYGIQSLTNLPRKKLPSLIASAEAHAKEKGYTA